MAKTHLNGQCRKRLSTRSGSLKRMRERRPALFRGRHFRDEIIVLCVRWYLRYPLSYRNLEEMMAEASAVCVPWALISARYQLESTAREGWCA
jgi:hypothetical protein